MQVEALTQGWTLEQSVEFYNLPQGSKLMPYSWFLHLERDGNAELFRSQENMRSLGFLTRTPDAANPDGLPIGIARDPSPNGGASVGLTCAACHTSQIDLSGTTYLIDGGPSHVDLQGFLTGLVEALRSTREDPEKFDRLVANVLGSSPSEAEKAEFEDRLAAVLKEREGYNARNLPSEAIAAFGHGRVDAFGAIMNEVTVRFLQVPENAAQANAPVSFPPLWDTPQHDRVQWNGVAKNTVLPLSVAGTRHVGALGRNIGEVLGVFGSTDPSADTLFTYPSTVNLQNLVRLEELARSLWSPRIPLEIDAGAKAKGAEHYKSAGCQDCHGDPAGFDRKSPSRTVKAQMRDVGTDPTMFTNVATRVAKTGVIQGRMRAANPFKVFGETAPFDEIIAHVVARTMLGVREDGAHEDPRDEQVYSAVFSPTVTGFEIDGVGTLLGEFEDVTYDPKNKRYSFVAKSAVTLLESTGEPHPYGRDLPPTGAKVSDWTRDRQGYRLLTADRDAFERAAKISEPTLNVYRLADSAGLGDAVVFDEIDGTTKAMSNIAWLRNAPLPPDESAPLRSGRRLELDGARPKVAYKARPLNGVWATAPYLHNGSVPNLTQLLTPPGDRLEEFRVGSHVYDSENAGFVSDSGPFQFDTRQPGNSNAGHPFGTDLSPDEKQQLIAYLMSL